MKKKKRTLTLISLEMEERVLALVILCLISKADNQSVAGPKPSMSKLYAVTQCSKTGSTLLNYKDVKANPPAPEYLNQLGEKESAWIEGYAQLSPFLSWQGCFTKTDLKINTRIVAVGYRSIYKCLQLCKGYTYIGLKDSSCYCISQKQRIEIQHVSVHDSFCSIPCFNNAIDSCGGHTYMSVYGILDNGQIHWAVNEPSSHLCVYVKRKQLIFEAFTASCHYLQSDLINGYICTDSAWSRMSTTDCSKLTTTEGTYCIMEDMSSWTEASEGCFRRNGTLTHLGAEKDTPAYLKYNFKYWIGVHRTFGITETYRDGETVCLSATRVGNMLYLEPDDCSAQKYYLCGSARGVKTSPILLTTAISDHTSTVLPSQTVNTGISSREDNKPSVALTVDEDKSYDSMSVPALILSVVTFVATVVCVTLVTILLRRMKKNHNNTNDAMYLTPTTETETTPYYTAVQ